MTDSLLPDSPAPAEPSALDLLSQRRAQRSQPVPPLMTPEAIRERLGRALGERLGTRDPRRRRTLAHLVYVLMAAPVATNAQLAAAAGLTPQATQRVADGLVRAGLADLYYEKNVRYQYLTPAGEDWVLPVAQGTA